MKAFDIGANKGQSIEVLLKKGYEYIVSAEAHPHLGPHLKQVYAADSRIFVVNKVICEHQKGQLFYPSNADTISTTNHEWITKSRFRNNYVWYSPTMIESTTLDCLIKEHGEPDFIKVDVEGGEREVFKGLTKCDAKIAFEWTEELFDDIVEESINLLKLLGYEKFSYQLDDDLLEEPQDESYVSWENCSIHQIIDKKRYEKWGLIWAKK